MKTDSRAQKGAAPKVETHDHERKPLTAEEETAFYAFGMHRRLIAIVDSLNVLKDAIGEAIYEQETNFEAYYQKHREMSSDLEHQRDRLRM